MRLWDKYLVQRRDGTVPDWPYIVMGAADPAAPAAIRAYALAAEGLGMDPAYVADLKRLAFSFEDWRRQHDQGDPDAPPHRPDDPEVVARIKAGSTPDGWRRQEPEAGVPE
jgi:hypothetical protein